MRSIMISGENRLVHVDAQVPSSIVKEPKEMGLVEGKEGCWSLPLPAYSDLTATKLETNQLIWRAKKPITYRDIQEVVDHALAFDQTIHINTGTHGDMQGNTAFTKKELGEAKFVKQDMGYVWNKKSVSVHIVSSFSAPIYPPNVNQIIDAWCFSSKSKNKESNKGIFLRRTCKKCKEAMKVKLGEGGTYNVIQEMSRKFIDFTCQCPYSDDRFTLMIKTRKYTLEYMKQGQQQSEICITGKKGTTLKLKDYYIFFQVRGE